MILCLGLTPTVQRTMTFASLTLDAVNRTADVHEFASGKSTNVARVLHTLGEQPVALGVLGGPRGRFFRADLDRVEIEHDFVEVEAPTRLCITVIDQSTRTATELLEESRPITSTDHDTVLDRLLKRVEQAKLLVLSGTLPPGANANFYARCVKLAQPAIPVIVDAVGPPLIEALAGKPFVVKPNRSELGRTLGIDVESDQAMRDAMQQLISRGARWVVVTEGKHGVVVTDGQSFWRITTPAIEVVSAIGSGDSFAAGLAAGIVQGMEVPQACILGAACGSANAMIPHAGHVRSDDVAAIQKAIRLETI